MNAPSAWQVEQAMSIAQATLNRLQNAGDIPQDETDEDALLAALRDGGSDVEALLRRLIRAVLEAKSDKKAVEGRMVVLAERGNRYERREQAWRGAAFAIMDALGIAKLADPEFTASIGAPRETVTITDEAAVPDEYWETPPRRLKKAAINEAVLRDGMVVAGTERGNGLPALILRTR